ncbi:MAG TPA: hypothetical protein VFG75_05155 [Gaiella sp.]|nr:hypothetical protein [Gaiella sp.]
MAEPVPLPTLIDCGGIVRELGVKRATAEAIMRQLPKVQVPGHRKVFVVRADLARFIAQWTIAA